MNLIFAKLYEQYLKRNDAAKGRITAYISIIYFLIIFTIILPVKTYIEKKIFHNEVHLEKSIIFIVTFGLMAIIISIVYFIYIKNNYIQKLTERYRKRKISKFAIYFISVVIIPLLVLLAGIITVLLNGGAVFGNEVEGLLK